MKKKAVKSIKLPRSKADEVVTENIFLSKQSFGEFKPNEIKQDAIESPLITREEALGKIGSFAVISAATMMVLIPSKAHAEGSQVTPSSAPPPPPPKHGIF